MKYIYSYLQYFQIFTNMFNVNINAFTLYTFIFTAN